jgi:hypothetical protein
MAMKKAAPKKTDPKPPTTTPKQRAMTEPGRSIVGKPAQKETPSIRAKRLQLELRRRENAKANKLEKKFLSNKNKGL